MGLSLSLLVSAWQEIATHNLFSLVFGVRFSGESENKPMALRSNSFSKAEVASRNTNMTTVHSNKSNSKNSIKLASEPVKLILQSSLSFTDLVQDTKKPDSTKLNSAISLPDPTVMFSPRPLHELDAAAVTVQKVYKSYRTRRNLADCAVVAEELWWKAMDFVALNRSSVSFFNEEKHETAISRWARARTRAAKVGKGLSKDEKAQKLALQHWLEAIDPRHRYGHNLHFYYDKWFQSESCQPFFYWLDVGDGKEMNLEKCPRSNLQKQCIKYLGPKEREEYAVVIENGKLVFKQSGALVDTVEGSKWIFVLSTTRNLYVGQKKKGKFQHSSFLAGGAITAAGRLVAHGGILEAIWPYSGHYLPTEENFREFISFLDVHKVDLLNVKRCATDDDTPPSNIPNIQSDSSLKKLEETTTYVQSSTEPETTASENKPAYSLSQRMSRKWTTGTGPRIGCVREYPSEVQFQALERVNLSPRVPYGSMANYGPIPSPRPSPKVRLSPRVSYIGMQSPRTPIAAAG